MAAADFGTARRIVALSPREWMQGHEYDDDFCYAQTLHQLLSAPNDRPALDPWFDRFERALDGRQDARLDVTRAIADRKQPEFEEAFDALLRQRTRRIDEEKARNRIEDPMIVWAERHI